MTSQRDYRLELRQSSTFAGVSSIILVKSSIISGINPEQRIYRQLYSVYAINQSDTLSLWCGTWPIDIAGHKRSQRIL